MEIWVALLIEFADGRDQEPVPIEVFLSEKECSAFVRGSAVFDAAREMEVMGENKYYTARCAPLQTALT